MNRITSIALCVFLCGATPEFAGSEPGSAAASPCEKDLFVAVTGDPQKGDGSAGNPYRTITKAVARAREIRSACADPITIHVGPGDYAGSFPIGSSTVETLPILIDIPDVELRGSSVLDVDERGLPTGTSSGATTLAITGPNSNDTSDDLTAMIFVASDAGKTNHVTITGFVIDGSAGTDPATVGIAMDRVQDFIVRGNIVTGLPGSSGPGQFNAGISTRAASGLVEGNYVANNNVIGISITGGNTAFPANVTVKGNRAVWNSEAGTVFAGAGDTAYPFNPRPESSTAETFDTIVGTVIANDLSNNTTAGIWLLGTTVQTVASATWVTAAIDRNTMDGNTYGVVIEAGHPWRGPLPYTGSKTVTFEDNVISNSGATAALVTFGGSIHADPITEPTDPKQTILFKYFQNSTYTITHTGELGGIWIDHPVQDPVDCRTLCNDLQINGVVYAPPIRSPGLGPAFPQALVPMAPVPSACPPPEECPERRPEFEGR